MPHLAKGFDISEETDLISSGGLHSDASKMPCVVETNWCIQESNGRKADWQFFDSLSPNRKLCVLLQIKKDFQNFTKNG